MCRHTHQSGEKIGVSSVGELSLPLPPSPICLPSCHLQGAVLCCHKLPRKEEGTRFFCLVVEEKSEEKVHYASICHLLCLSMRELLLVSVAVGIMLMLLNCE